MLGEKVKKTGYYNIPAVPPVPGQKGGRPGTG